MALTDACCSKAQTLVARYSRLYALTGTPVIHEVERDVLGCDYGGTSWTTREEADRVIDMLALGAGKALLDIGAGSGWPALYIARMASCDAVLIDVPFSGMRAARERAVKEGLAERCKVTVGDGASLPFKDASFDAISHSDVLCCMPEKVAMLRECRRVARAGARMAFSVIAPAPDLSVADRELAVASGPMFVDVSADYSALLRETGWRLLERHDVTDEYGHCLRKLIAAMELHAGELASTMGEVDFTQRIEDRRASLAALVKRLLKRELFVGQAQASD